MREAPDPSATPVWSYSRDVTFRLCKRKYFYRYHLAAGGWRREATERSRRCFALARLTSLSAALGQSIHLRAREIGAAIVAGARPPEESALLEATLRDLNRLWAQSRRRDEYLRDPIGWAMLRDAYYGVAIPTDVVAEIRRRAGDCIRNLAASAVWRRWRRTPSSDRLTFERPLTFVVDGVQVWAAPDLVLTDADGRTAIIDWKTGRSPGAAEVEQLCVYALLCREVLDRRGRPSGYRGEAVGLADGASCAVDLGPADLASATDRIVTAAEAMGHHTSRWAAGTLTLQEAFPRTPHTTLCRSCEFQQVCLRDPDGDCRQVLPPTSPPPPSTDRSAPVPGEV